MTDDILDLRKEFESRFFNKPIEFKAVLGRADGTVEESENRVYITLMNGQVDVVYNGRVPRRPWRKIVVGYDPNDYPDLLQVLRFDDVYNDPPPPHVPNHKDSHTWFSHDPIDVYAEQFYPLLPRAVGGLVIRVYGGNYYANGSRHILITDDYDLSAEAVTDGAEWVNLEVDEDGVVTYQHGDNYATKWLLTPENIPATPTTKKLLCSVKMYDEQAEFIQIPGNSDIFDPRFSGESSGGLADSIDWTEILNKPTEFAPENGSVYYTGRTEAFIDPTVNDDVSLGFLVLHLWINTATGDKFILVDNTDGAADWQPLLGGSGDIEWSIDGALAVLETCAIPKLITRNTVIGDVYLYLEDTGSIGTTSFDISLLGISGLTSILSAPIQLDYSDANGWVKVTPITTEFVEGDILVPSIDGVATGASGARLIIQVISAGGAGGAFNLLVEDESSTVSVSNVGSIIVPDGALSDEGGGVVKILTGDPVLDEQVASSSATLDFTTHIDSSYDEYIFELVNILPSTDGAHLYIRVGTGVGPSWDTGNNYVTAGIAWVYNASATFGNSVAALIAQFTTSNANDVSNGSNYGLSGQIKLYDPAGGKHPKLTGELNWIENSNTNEKGSTFRCRYVSTTPITSVRFFFSSGNIASGAIRMYGVMK